LLPGYISKKIISVSYLFIFGALLEQLTLAYFPLYGEVRLDGFGLGYKIGDNILLAGHRYGLFLWQRVWLCFAIVSKTRSAIQTL